MTQIYLIMPMSAVRIARIVDQGRSVALIGPIGSGKSSILNLVRGQLDQTTVTTIVARFDVWAVSRSEDAPRVVLACIIEALDDYVDTIGVRTLPVTYQRLVRRSTGECGQAFRCSGRRGFYRNAPSSQADSWSVERTTHLDCRGLGTYGYDIRHAALAALPVGAS